MPDKLKPDKMKNDTFYIKSVTISNLFGYKDIKWELLPDVNILGGINGSGKSTIMTAIYELTTAGFLDDRLVNLMDNVEIEFTNGAVIRWENEKATLKTYQPDDKFRYKVDTTKTDEDGMFKVQKSRFQDKDGNILKIGLLGESICIDMLSAFEQMKLRQDISEIIGDTRLQTSLDLMLYKEINKRNEMLVSSIRFLTLINNHKEIVRLQKELQEIMYTEDSNKEFGEKIDKLEETINNKLDFTSQSLIDIHEVLDNFFYSTGKTSVKDSGTFMFMSGKDKINYLQLSTGEKQLLLVLLKTFNTENRNGIMLLDEADLGMHIEWKEKLISTLRDINPNLQIITTTHAPSIIRGWFDNVQEMSDISTDN